MTIFKSFRIKSGLSVNQAARLLSIDPVSVRRFEMNPDRSTSRNPPALALKVLQWYIDHVPPAL